MKLPIELLSVEGAVEKYTSIMDALEASEGDYRFRGISFRTASFEQVKLERTQRHQSFVLKYIDASDSRLDDGFEAQTRDHMGALRYWKTVAEALARARRDGLIWKLSFPVPTGERVRLVRDLGTGDFVLDMMETHIARVLQQARGGHR